MSAPEHFDYISIGSGEAGKYIAWNLSANQGKRCAVIERKWIGGSCPNIACLPSKNFLHSANVAHDLRSAQSYGLGAYVQSNNSLKVDLASVKRRKVEMVDGLVDMHLGKFRETGVELISGEGRFVGPKTIQIDVGRLLTADTIVINTGSRATIDSSIKGLVEAKPLTHIDILDSEQLPAHLVIIGGGYVALEFAQAFKRFGSEVTVLEHNEQILKNEDEDVVNALLGVLKEEGIRFITSARVTEVQGISGQGVQLSVELPQGELQHIKSSHLMVAAGRTPNTSGIGLEKIGVKLTAIGHVQVDEQLRTTADGVFAVGDCAGSPHFTHIGFDDFRIVYSYLIGTPKTKGTSGRQVPSTLFTSPELAHVGLHEHEAKAKGIKYRLAKLPMAAFLRTRTLGDTRGFAKALIEADGNGILGFTALGPSAGEMLPVVQLAMKLGVGYQEIAGLVITHPTMCEGLLGLFSMVQPRIH
ncbi:putative dihydrolipoyl dehydrogenase protein [Phaeoacremonium minimum UCRPA7]|uniref:Putative dihydrolipoyl dehydrogenase protein n=1 Tax=Phaeoacremonium minimum (strain UCR-PA7) TaxID=1286976 RepID=R8BLG8_PHAM7|nr:putative dihydrolipoyl dehydrogenase protein [Phaeoacremonium minimum UCRPA7]EOO00199.1 putative dihydrolipoyl dehydrogenase protein [Phaeoacremonium minimum UCRPA7]